MDDYDKEVHEAYEKWARGHRLKEELSHDLNGIYFRSDVMQEYCSFYAGYVANSHKQEKRNGYTA